MPLGLSSRPNRSRIFHLPGGSPFNVDPPILFGFSWYLVIKVRLLHTWMSAAKSVSQQFWQGTSIESTCDFQFLSSGGGNTSFCSVGAMDAAFLGFGLILKISSVEGSILPKVRDFDPVSIVVVSFNAFLDALRGCACFFRGSMNATDKGVGAFCWVVGIRLVNFCVSNDSQDRIRDICCLFLPSHLDCRYKSWIIFTEMSQKVSLESSQQSFVTSAFSVVKLTILSIAIW